MKFWTTVKNISHYLLTPLDEDMFWHCTFCIAVNTKHRYFREYRMCVKLAVTLNVKLEYVFFTWGNAQSLWVPFFTKTLLFEDAECCNTVFWVLLVRPRDGKLTHNGDSRVGTLAFENLKMSNFPWAAPQPPPPPPSCCKPLIGALYVRWPNPIKFDCVRFPNVPWLRRVCYRGPDNWNRPLITSYLSKTYLRLVAQAGISPFWAKSRRGILVARAYI